MDGDAERGRERRRRALQPGRRAGIDRRGLRGPHRDRGALPRRVDGCDRAAHPGHGEGGYGHRRVDRRGHDEDHREDGGGPREARGRPHCRAG